MRQRFHHDVLSLFTFHPLPSPNPYTPTDIILVISMLLIIIFFSPSGSSHQEVLTVAMGRWRIYKFMFHLFSIDNISAFCCSPFVNTAISRSVSSRPKELVPIYLLWIQSIRSNSLLSWVNSHTLAHPFYSSHAHMPTNANKKFKTTITNHPHTAQESSRRKSMHRLQTRARSTILSMPLWPPACLASPPIHPRTFVHRPIHPPTHSFAHPPARSLTRYPSDDADRSKYVILKEEKNTQEGKNALNHNHKHTTQPPIEKPPLLPPSSSKSVKKEKKCQKDPPPPSSDRLVFVISFSFAFRCVHSFVRVIHYYEMRYIG